MKVVPGSSAVIYAYDTATRQFDTTSRVAVGSLVQAAFDDGPRPGGFGMRAISQQRRVISYEEPDLQIHPGIAATGTKGPGMLPYDRGRSTNGWALYHAWVKHGNSRALNF